MPLLYSISGILFIDGFCTRGECRYVREGKAVLTSLPVRSRWRRHGVHERDDGDDGDPEPVSETGAHSDGLPRCAGVGVEESKVWVCRTCRDAL